MERKTLRAAGEIKAAAEGRVEARFATLGVKDRDGDVILPGAFGVQEVRVSAFGHTSWGGALPVGKGRIRESGNEALADLQFFMETTPGRDHFNTIRGLGELGEWSFGFDILEEGAPDEDQRAAGVQRILRKLDVHEVSPVLRGAGIDTATLGVKCDACRARERQGEDGPDVEGAVLDALRTQDTAKRVLEGRGPRPGDPDFFRQPHKESADLAEFAAAVGHRLLGCPHHIRPPDVAWFPRCRKRSAHGFVREGLHVVYVALDRRGSGLVETVLHELKHLAQRAAGEDLTEWEADAFARGWAGPVEAAHRYAEGKSWKVAIRETGPPFSTRDRKHVVLSGGAAWTYHWRNRGSPWSAHK